MKKCNRCGYKTDENLKFCPMCGYEMVELSAALNNFGNSKTNIIHCPSCGTENNSNVKFCLKCGTALGNAVTAPANLNTVSKKTKSKKGKKVVLGISIPAAVIAIVCIVLAVFFPKIQMAVLGESAYYFYKEAENISSLLQAETISDLRHPDSYSAVSTANIDISGDELLSELIGTMQATADVDYDADSATVQSSLSLEASGDTLLTLIGNYADSKFIIGSDSTDSYLVFDNPFLSSSSDTDFQSFGDSDSLEYYELIECISQIDKEELISVLINISSDYIDTKAVKSDGVIGNEDAEIITFTFTDEQLDEILVALINEIMNSESLSAFVQEIFDVYEYDDLDLAGLAEAVEKDGFFRYKFEYFEFSYAVNSKGNIIYRGYEVNYGSYSSIGEIYTDFDGSEVVSLSAEIIVDTDFDDVFLFSIDKETVDDAMNIDISFSDSYVSVIIDVDEMRAEECGGVPVLLGKCCVTYTIDDYTEFELNASAENVSEQYNIDISCEIDGDELFSAGIATVLSTNADVSGVSVPSNYETEVMDYLEDLFDNVINGIAEYIDEYYYAYYYDNYYSYYYY